MVSLGKHQPRPLDLLVNVDVGDAEQAARFYSSALGLRVGRRLGSNIIELLGANTPIFLLQKADGSTPFEGATTSRSYARHWTPVHFDVVVPDLDVAVRRARAAGAGIESGPHVDVWGKLAQLADPWGNGFCLLEFTDKGYDAIAVEPTTG